MMSYEPVRSRYVKLTKDQDAPLEEIRPGELNQPVRVPQVRAPIWDSVFDVLLFWIFHMIEDGFKFRKKGFYSMLILPFLFQLGVRRCPECGQPLPESYEPPADESWTTAIGGCAKDPESCKISSSFMCLHWKAETVICTYIGCIWNSRTIFFVWSIVTFLYVIHIVDMFDIIFSVSCS